MVLPGRRRDSSETLRLLRHDLTGRTIHEARVRVESLGGTLHRVEELGSTKTSRSRVNVRVANDVVVGVVGLG